MGVLLATAMRCQSPDGFRSWLRMLMSLLPVHSPLVGPTVCRGSYSNARAPVTLPKLFWRAPPGSGTVTGRASPGRWRAGPVVCPDTRYGASDSQSPLKSPSHA